MKKSVLFTALALSFSSVYAQNENSGPSEGVSEVNANYPSIVINNYADKTGLELGDNSRARGVGSIATGRNSIAIGTNAVATGNNESKETILRKLEENKTKLAEIDQQKANVNNLIKEIQDLRAKEARVIEAGERVKQVREAKQRAYDDWQTKLTAYNKAVSDSAQFFEDAQRKIDDFNSRLNAVSRLPSVNIQSQESLDQASQQLKGMVEENTSLDLDVGFYKDYIVSHYKALGDLRLNKIKASNFSDTYFTGSSPSFLPASSIPFVLSIDYKLHELYIINSKIDGIENFAINLESFGPHSQINLSQILNKEDFEKRKAKLNEDEIKIINLLKSNNDPLIEQEHIELTLQIAKISKEFILKSYEIAFYQGEYERTHDTSWLDKKLTAINEQKNLSSQFYGLETSRITDTRYAKFAAWKKENITDIEEKNKITTEKLTADLQSALNINLNAIKEKEAQIEALKKSASQAEANHNAINPNPEDLLYASQYEKVMADLQRKASDLENSQNRLKALQEALSLHDLTNVGENAIAIGTDAIANGKNSIALGTKTVAVGEDSIAIGTNSSVTGTASYAVGKANIILSDNSGAFGGTNTIYGNGSYAIGNNIKIGEEPSILGQLPITPDSDNVPDHGDSSPPDESPEGSSPIKEGNKPTLGFGENTFVFGSDVTTRANNAVILGHKSKADVDNVVSVGEPENKRKIIYVANGDISAESSDAINGSQLHDVLQNGTGVNVSKWKELLGTVSQISNDLIQQINANIANKADKNASNLTDEDVVAWSEKLGTGESAEGNTGLITGGTLHESLKGKADKSELTTAKADIANKADKNAGNLGDSDVTAWKDKLGVTDLGSKVDTKLEKDASNLTDEGVTNLTEKLGTGEVAKGNTNLVTGDKVAVAIEGKANKSDLESAKTDIANKADKNAGNLSNEDVTAWQDKLGTGKNEKGNTGLVTGDTLNSTVNNITTTVKADIANKADKNASNLTDEDVVAWSEKLGTGENAEGNTGLITGGTLYESLKGKADKSELTTAKADIANKADKNAGNLGDSDVTAWKDKLGVTDLGSKVDTKLEKDASNLTDEGVTNLTEKLGTGEVAKGNTNLVTGDKVAVAIEGKADKSDLESAKTDIANKADKNAGNLSNEDVVAWQDKLGTGKNEKGNTGLVTGDTLNSTVNNITTTVKADISNKADKNAGNLGDSDVTAWKDKLGVTDLGSKVDTKLEKDASNLTDEGVTNLTEKLGKGKYQKGDTNLITGDTLYTTVEKINASGENKADKNAGNLSNEDVNAWQDKLGTGKNEKGNTGLVTGDTLNSTVNNITTTVNANIANKADKNASNLSNEDVNAWSEKLGKGKFAKGDKGLVTGDTLYSSVETINTNISNKAEKNASNLTDEDVVAWSGKLGTGTINEGDTRLITGDTVHKTISNMSNNFSQQLNSVEGRLSKEINKTKKEANAGIASAMAIGLLPVTPYAGKTGLSASVGTYNGSSALAIGVSHTSGNGKWAIKGGVSVNNKSKIGGGVGVLYTFD